MNTPAYMPAISRAHARATIVLHGFMTFVRGTGGGVVGAYVGEHPYTQSAVSHYVPTLKLPDIFDIVHNIENIDL